MKGTAQAKVFPTPDIAKSGLNLWELVYTTALHGILSGPGGNDDPSAVVAKAKKIADGSMKEFYDVATE